MKETPRSLTLRGVLEWLAIVLVFMAAIGVVILAWLVL